MNQLPDPQLDAIQQFAATSVTAPLQGLPVQSALTTLVRDIEPADFSDLAEVYLGARLRDADGKERLPQRTEALVIIADHFREILEAKASGIARLNGQLHLYVGDHWKPLENDESQTVLGNFAQALGHRTSDSRHYRFREELRRQVESVSPPISQPGNQSMVNFANGTLHITGEGEDLRGHAKKDGLTYALPFSYDPEARCPLFDRYLNRVLPDEECQTVVMEFLGWIFLRELKLEKMLVLYGSGHNGKSVLFDVISDLLGEANVSALSLESLKSPEKRIPLLGKLLNYGSELSGNVSPDTLKKASSGEPLEFRRLYGDPFTSTDYARLAFNANNLPTETEITDGYFRRFLIIPFEQIISQEEKDPDLARKISASELPGVMNRVLAGMKQLRKNRKFSPCAIADECLKDYQLESDNVAQFLREDEWVADPTETIAKGEFYQLYKDFCLLSGFHALGIKNFTCRLKKHHHIQEKKSGSVRYWHLSQRQNE